MPTYEYACKKCGHFERVQKMSDPPLKRCPKCRGAVRRLIGGGAGVIFKGSGFYITDYRSENYKKTAKSEAGDSSSTKSETKTPSKPAKTDSSAK